MGSQHTTPRHERYTPLTVELELGCFTRDRDDWPSWTEFEQAGLKGLRKAVDRFGGARSWAAKLGKRHAPHPGRPSWTEQRITAELDRITPTLKLWPSSQEWVAMGCAPLQDAMRRHGGVRRWARHYSFTAPNCRGMTSCSRRSCARWSAPAPNGRENRSSRPPDAARSMT
jgi:hypothetical protein